MGQITSNIGFSLVKTFITLLSKFLKKKSTLGSGGKNEICSSFRVRILSPISKRSTITCNSCQIKIVIQVLGIAVNAGSPTSLEDYRVTGFLTSQIFPQSPFIICIPEKQLCHWQLRLDPMRIWEYYSTCLSVTEKSLSLTSSWLKLLEKSEYSYNYKLFAEQFSNALINVGI